MIWLRISIPCRGLRNKRIAGTHFYGKDRRDETHYLGRLNRCFGFTTRFCQGPRVPR